MANQRKTAFAGALGLFVVAGVVLLVSLLLLELLLWFNGIEGWLALAMIVAFFAVIFFLYNKFKPNTLKEIQIPIDGKTLPQAALENVGYDALGAFASPDEMPGFVKMVLAMFITAPRAVEAGRRTLKQVKALEEFDHESCGRILKAVFKASRRIEFGKIVDKFGSKMDMQSVLPQLLLIDGVLLHKREPAGIEAAPSLTEEFEAWRKSNPVKSDDEDYDD